MSVTVGQMKYPVFDLLAYQALDILRLIDEMRDEATDKTTLPWLQIEKFLETYQFIMNADIRTLYNVSAATDNRILAGFAANGNRIKCRQNVRTSSLT